MEKVVRIFRSHQEADDADLRNRRSMTPHERLEVFFAIQQRGVPDAINQRLARVYRIIKREQG